MRAFLERHSSVIGWAVAPHKEKVDELTVALARAEDNVANIQEAAREQIALSDHDRIYQLQQQHFAHEKDIALAQQENADLRRTNRVLVERLTGLGQKADPWPAEACGNCGMMVSETLDKHVMGTVSDREGKYLLYCDGTEEPLA